MVEALKKLRQAGTDAASAVESLTHHLFHRGEGKIPWTCRLCREEEGP